MEHGPAIRERRMLRVAVWGPGGVGALHARTIAASPDSSLVALCGRELRGAEALAAPYGAKGFTDPGRILDDPSVDAVVVALPSDLHVTAGEDVIRAGKHLLLEKPLCHLPEDLSRLGLAAASAPGVQVMIAHTHRFSAESRAARELVESGAIGDVIAATALVNKPWDLAARRAWHLSAERGGGMWIANGVHGVERVLSLFPTSPPTVRASVTTRAHPQEADDSAWASLTFANGGVGLVCVNGYATGAPYRRTTVLATEGALDYSDGEGLRVGRDGEWRELVAPATDWLGAAMEAQWRSFVDLVLREAPNESTLANAERVMEVVFAAQRSQAAQAEVRLP